jgi:hypothetical protein
MSEGTPDNPVVMSGALQESAGEWGGLVISGNAPVNGCNEDVELCEIPFEAITSETFGGNQPEDNSGVLKYTQILFAGFAVRPNEELNGLTLNAVGSGTLIALQPLTGAFPEITRPPHSPADSCSAPDITTGLSGVPSDMILESRLIQRKSAPC